MTRLCIDVTNTNAKYSLKSDSHLSKKFILFASFAFCFILKAFFLLKIFKFLS